MAVNNGVHRVRERKTQSFDTMVPQYFLNNKGHLEESPIMKDMQEVINSAEYTRLDEIYDRMIEINRDMHQQFTGGDMVLEREKYEDDLDILVQFDAIKNAYASENPEVANMNHGQIVEHIRGKLDKQNKLIEDKKKEKEKKPHEEI